MKDETKKGLGAAAPIWRTCDGPDWVAFEPADPRRKAMWREAWEARPPFDMPACELVGYAVTEVGVFAVGLMGSGPSARAYIEQAYGPEVPDGYARAVCLELTARGVFGGAGALR